MPYCIRSAHGSWRAALPWLRGFAVNARPPIMPSNLLKINESDIPSERSKQRNRGDYHPQLSNSSRDSFYVKRRRRRKTEGKEKRRFISSFSKSVVFPRRDKSGQCRQTLGDIPRKQRTDIAAIRRTVKTQLPTHPGASTLGQTAGVPRCQNR